MRIVSAKTINLGDFNSCRGEVELDADDLTDLCVELKLPESLLTLTEKTALLRFKSEVILYQQLVALGANDFYDKAVAAKARFDDKVAKLSTQYPVEIDQDERKD